MNLTDFKPSRLFNAGREKGWATRSSSLIKGGWAGRWMGVRWCFRNGKLLAFWRLVLASNKGFSRTNNTVEDKGTKLVKDGKDEV